MAKSLNKQVETKKQVEFYFGLLNCASHYYVNMCNSDAQKEIQKIIRNQQDEQTRISSEQVEADEEK